MIVSITVCGYSKDYQLSNEVIMEVSNIKVSISDTLTNYTHLAEFVKIAPEGRFKCMDDYITRHHHSKMIEVAEWLSKNDVGEAHIALIYDDGKIDRDLMIDRIIDQCITKIGHRVHARHDSELYGLDLKFKLLGKWLRGSVVYVGNIVALGETMVILKNGKDYHPTLLTETESAWN